MFRGDNTTQNARLFQTRDQLIETYYLLHTLDLDVSGVIRFALAFLERVYTIGRVV